MGHHVNQLTWLISHLPLPTTAEGCQRTYKWQCSFAEAACLGTPLENHVVLCCRSPVVWLYSLQRGFNLHVILSVALKHRFLGKAQLYLTLSGAPRDVACQVQPHRGLEAHTVFSVFCVSGRPVLLTSRTEGSTLGLGARSLHDGCKAESWLGGQSVRGFSSVCQCRCRPIPAPPASCSFSEITHVPPERARF